jgi:hypothetical protein
MKNNIKIAIACLLFASCKVGDCSKWKDVATKSYINIKNVFSVDSLSYIELNKYLNNKLQDSIIRSNHPTWSVDSLSTQIRDIDFRNKMLHFFSKNQLEGGSLIDKNTVFFYFKENSTITLSEDCNILFYLLIYLKDDVPKTHPEEKYLKYRNKVFKITNNWYLHAYLNK